MNAQDMYCVGLKPEFHIIRSIISSYYDRGRKADALCFVKKMLEIGVDDDAEDPVSILVFKMVRSGEQKEAIEVVRTLREGGFELRVSAYSAALLAIVKEQEQVSCSLSKIDYLSTMIILKRLFTVSKSDSSLASHSQEPRKELN